VIQSEAFIARPEQVGEIVALDPVATLQKLTRHPASVVRKHGPTCELVGAANGTDAAAIAATGVPTVVFGPGSIGQAHTADEYISVDALGLATDIFHRIARDGLR
jgi:acetylornithine deacetylase